MGYLATLPYRRRRPRLNKARLEERPPDERAAARGSVDAIDWETVDRVAKHAARMGDYCGLRDAAIICVGSDGALRGAELAALNVVDILYNEDGSGVVVIRKSKKDQEGQGAYLYLGPETVSYVRRYLAESGHSSGALWRSAYGQKAGERLSRASIANIIKERSKKAKVKGRFAAHSLRRGTAISLVRKGATVSEIMQTGRWKEPRMVAHYAGEELASRNAVAKYRYR